MGLSTLPAVGTGEALGPTKRNRALQTPDLARDIDADEWNAAAVALEGVCAEVGLSNGTTPGSLVARVTAIEEAPPGSGDVTGPDGAVTGNIAVLDSTGKILADGGVAVAAITAAQDAADAAQATANAAQATANAAVTGPGSSLNNNLAAWYGTGGSVLSDTGIPGSFVLFGAVGSGVYTLATNATLVDESNRALIVITDDVTVTVPHTLTPQTRYDFRIGGSYALTLATSGGIALTWHGAAAGAISGDGTRVSIEIESDTVAHVYVWPVGNGSLSPATHTGATLTLSGADHNGVLRVSAASNAVAVEIPDSLPGGDSGDAEVWECQLDIVDGETNAVTISTGSGLLTPVYMGSLNAITVDGTKVAIQVVRGAASVIIVEPYA